MAVFPTVYMESMSSPWALHMGSMESISTPWALHMESIEFIGTPWTVLLMESMESMSNPWALTLRGLHLCQFNLIWCKKTFVILRTRTPDLRGHNRHALNCWATGPCLLEQIRAINTHIDHVTHHVTSTTQNGNHNIHNRTTTTATRQPPPPPPTLPPILPPTWQ